MNIVTFPAPPPPRLSRRNGQIDPRLEVQITIRRGDDPRVNRTEDRYWVTVLSAEKDYLGGDEYPTVMAAGDSLARILPSTTAKEAKAAIDAHFTSRHVGPISFGDDGIVFWSTFGEVDRDSGLDSIGRLTKWCSDRNVPPMLTLPISKFAFGGATTRALAALGGADLQQLHSNAVTMRDRTAGSELFASEEGKEIHDRYELGRRAATMAPEEIGFLDRDASNRCRRPLTSTAGQALEASMSMQASEWTPTEKVRRFLGFGR